MYAFVTCLLSFFSWEAFNPGSCQLLLSDRIFLFSQLTPPPLEGRVFFFGPVGFLFGQTIHRRIYIAGECTGARGETTNTTMSLWYNGICVGMFVRIFARSFFLRRHFNCVNCILKYSQPFCSICDPSFIFNHLYSIYSNLRSHMRMFCYIPKYSTLLSCLCSLRPHPPPPPPLPLAAAPSWATYCTGSTPPRGRTRTPCASSPPPPSPTWWPDQGNGSIHGASTQYPLPAPWRGSTTLFRCVSPPGMCPDPRCVLLLTFNALKSNGDKK